MSNIVPEKSNNFMVYIDGEKQAGIAEGNFPAAAFMTRPSNPIVPPSGSSSSSFS